MSDTDLLSARILIVEDEPSQQQFLKHILEWNGHEIMAESSAEAALPLISSFKPEIILADVHLPGMSGLEMVRKVHDSGDLTKCTIAFISDDKSEQTTVEGLRTSAEEFIFKPVRPNELLLKVQRWMQRNRIRSSFEHASAQMNRKESRLSAYFGDDVVGRIIAGNDAELLKGRNVDASVLFFDIRNFTGISEKIAPNLLADLLNLIFTDVMDLIFANNGSVNKIIGDGILATFGAPLPSTRDTENSVRCALAIRDTIKQFNLIKPSFLTEDLGFGIGIARGNLFAGNIGSYRRMEYTVIGDTVNTAARIQNLTKKAGVDILIDASTYEALRGRLEVRKLAVNSLRGKSNSVSIYHLINLSESGESDEIVFF